MGGLKSLCRAFAAALMKPRNSRRGYKRLHASSLAFKTLLALIPVLAVVMAILSSDALSQKRDQLLDQLVDTIYPVETFSDNSVLDPLEPGNLQKLNEAGKQQIRISMKKFANHAHKTGFFGFLGFAAIVLLLLRDVENSFNFLWGVTRGRSLLDQLFRNSIFILVAPPLILFLVNLKKWVQDWNLLGHGMNNWFFLTAVPFAALWAVCAWMYAWIPNAKVERRTAIWAGLLAAVLLKAAQEMMNWYSLNIFARSNVYGALWVIPVILIWFYVSWAVVLFGAEVSFIFQEKMKPAASRREGL